MFISVRGRRIPIISYSMEESVWDYAPCIRMLLGELLDSDVWSWDESSLEYEVVSVRVEGTAVWSYLSYPRSYMEMSRRLSVPVSREDTIAGLCGCFGLPFVTQHSATSLSRHWWVLGSMRGRRLFDSLVLGCGCSGGGCSTLHYTPSGMFCYTDLLAVRGLSSVFSFIGTSGDYLADRESDVVIPGILDVCFDDSRGVGVYERHVFQEGSSLGGIKTYLSNDELRDYRIWCQRNRYWRSRLRSMTMTFTGVNVVDGYLGVGVVCRYMDGSEQGVPMLCTRYYRDFTNTVSDIRIDCVPLSVLGGE